MSIFFRIAAYIFHPLFMPLLGTVLYYTITPRFLDIELISKHIMAVSVLTFIVPILLFFLLKNLGVLQSIHLPEVKQRKVPLMIQCILLLLLIKFIFNPYDHTELYFFYLGVLFTTLTALILVFFGFKVSLHQMGVAGLLVYIMMLSIHFEINLILWIGLFSFINGWVASSRLFTKSHTTAELTVGFFIGALPQFLLITKWL